MSATCGPAFDVAGRQSRCLRHHRGLTSRRYRICRGSTHLHHHNRPTHSRRHTNVKAPPTSPGLLGPLVNAVVLAGLAAVINQATSTNSIAIWVVVASLTVASAIVQWTTQARTMTARRQRLLGVGLIISSVLAVLTTAWWTVPEPVKSARVLQVGDGYRLVSADEISLTNFCPTRDKIDLDSGLPGYGGQPQLGDHLDGCRTNGGFAELILERTGFHGPNNTLLYWPLDRGLPANYSQCAKMSTARADARSTLPLDSLAAGSRVCVRTDLGNIALVTIEDISNEPGTSEKRVAVDYITWGIAS